MCRPHANQILYLGVLSPHHRWRAEITPDPPRASERPSETQGELAGGDLFQPSHVEGRVLIED